jgi:hypothetical protein
VEDIVMADLGKIVFESTQAKDHNLNERIKKLETSVKLLSEWIVKIDLKLTKMETKDIYEMTSMLGGD